MLDQSDDVPRSILREAMERHRASRGQGKPGVRAVRRYVELFGGPCCGARLVVDGEGVFGDDGVERYSLPIILRIDGATMQDPKPFVEAVYAYDSTRQHRSPGNLPRYWFESQVLKTGGAG